MRCALALSARLPHTTLPTPRGSASVLPATRGLLPALLPRAGGRWPARSAHPSLPVPPTSAGRQCGSADWFLHVLPVVVLLLAPGVPPPHAPSTLVHTGGINPPRTIPPHPLSRPPTCA